MKKKLQVRVGNFRNDCWLKSIFRLRLELFSVTSGRSGAWKRIMATDLNTQLTKWNMITTNCVFSYKFRSSRLMSRRTLIMTLEVQILVNYDPNRRLRLNNHFRNRRNSTACNLDPRLITFLISLFSYRFNNVKTFTSKTNFYPKKPNSCLI